MNFKYYDILSHLIPGFLIYAVVYVLFKEKLPELSVATSLVAAYIIGYFNNTFSSWLEGFYRLLWGGDPVNHFFDKKGIWKVRYYNGLKVKKMLIDTLQTDNVTNNQLFLEARRIANKNTTERLDDFNAKYAFSRALLTSILISGCIAIFSNYSCFYPYAIGFILFVIAFIRCYQRNGYYIREVLEVVDNSFNKK